MSENWVGISVASDQIIFVNLGFSSADAIYVNEDTTWKLQQGERPKAYAVMYERICNYLSENEVNHVVIKASALSRGGTRMSHLQSAELRGVVTAAVARTNIPVQVVSKAFVSRNFGERKTDEYVHDEVFWGQQLGDELRKGSREIALLVLSAKNHDK